jgi:hypothetical protein
MADAVTTKTLLGNNNRVAVRLTNISDGTGESAVAKLTLSSYTLTNGSIPTKAAIEEIYWSIQGFTSVRLLWDHTTDVVIDVLAPGSGYRPYQDFGALGDVGTGDTGNILLTTAGAISGATYDILLVVKLS